MNGFIKFGPVADSTAVNFWDDGTLSIARRGAVVELSGQAMRELVAVWQGIDAMNRNDVAVTPSSRR